MKQVNKKVAVITGSANGLGRALATELYEQGYMLALIDIDLDGLAQLKKELETENQTITTHLVNVANEQEVVIASQKIFEQHRRIDILINNAAISISQPFQQIDLADYKQLMEVNYWGTVYCSRHFLPYLQDQQDSRLVNIISDFALMGFPGKTAYASSKSAIMGFSNSLKTELAGTNTKVCLVIPPPLGTGLVSNGKHIDDSKKQKEINFIEKKGMPVDAAAKRIVPKIISGRFRIVIGSMIFWIDIASRFFPTALHNIIGKNKKKINFI